MRRAEARDALRKFMISQRELMVSVSLTQRSMRILGYTYAEIDYAADSIGLEKVPTEYGLYYKRNLY